MTGELVEVATDPADVSAGRGLDPGIAAVGDGVAEGADRPAKRRAIQALLRDHRRMDELRSERLTPENTSTALVVHRYGRTDHGRTDQATTVLLLHGLTEAGTAWPDLVEHWGGTYRILAPDLRGHGASPRFTPEELGRTSEVMLADVLALLAAEPEPVVLVGHSLGGNLALHAALARPDRVRALVLEDPASPWPEGDEAPEAPDFVAENEAFLDSMRTADDRAGQVARMLRESAWSRAEIEAWAACKPLVDRRYIREGLRLASGPWEALFQALAVPTLLVIPDPAPMAPRAEAVTNPLVRRAAVAGAGHCVRRDRPAAFATAVDAFLDEVLDGGDPPSSSRTDR